MAMPIWRTVARSTVRAAGPLMVGAARIGEVEMMLWWCILVGTRWISMTAIPSHMPN